MGEVTAAATVPGGLRASAGRGLTGGTLAVGLWGLAPVATRALVVQAPPLTLLAARFLIASLALLPWALPVFRRADRWSMLQLAAAGALGAIGYYLPVTFALRWLPASTAGLLLATEPLFVLVISQVLGMERVRRTAWAGSLTALAGVVALTGVAAGRQAGSARTVVGVVLVLAGTLAFAGYTIALRPVSRRWGALPATAASTVAGAVPYLAFTGGGFGAGLARFAPSGWGELAFLALGSTTLGTLLWNRAVAVAGSARVSVLLYLEPLVSVFGAVLFLREAPSPVVLAGGALILAGVILASRVASTS